MLPSVRSRLTGIQEATNGFCSEGCFFVCPCCLECPAILHIAYNFVIRLSHLPAILIVVEAIRSGEDRNATESAIP